MKRDKIIFDLIEKEKHRQQNGIELIASENFVSEQVMKAQGTVLTNKYAEGLPGKRYYGGSGDGSEKEKSTLGPGQKLFPTRWGHMLTHARAPGTHAAVVARLEPRCK